MKKVGKVIEVYIPNQYKNGNLLDVMDRTIIGFKVMINDEVKIIEIEQDDENVYIMKDDLVEIIEQNIFGKNYLDIRLYGGEEDE